MPRQGEIPTAKLRLSDVPDLDAGWYAFLDFALTFNGYEALGSFDACAEVANRTLRHFERTGELPSDLDTLRAALFFENRRNHHSGASPDSDELRYIEGLIRAIREQVRAREKANKSR